MIIKLIDYKKNFSRGTILRCPGQYPYEEIVDFMVAEILGQDDYALIVISGYKAGLTLVVLPPESRPNDNQGYAVDITWLKENWSRWGYIDCPLDEVWVIENSAPTRFDEY